MYSSFCCFFYSVGGAAWLRSCPLQYGPDAGQFHGCSTQKNDGSTWPCTTAERRTWPWSPEPHDPPLWNELSTPGQHPFLKCLSKCLCWKTLPLNSSQVLAAKLNGIYITISLYGLLQGCMWLKIVTVLEASHSLLSLFQRTAFLLIINKSLPQPAQYMADYFKLCVDCWNLETYTIQHLFL